MDMEQTDTEARPDSKKGVSRGTMILSFLALFIFLAILGWGLLRTQRGSIAIGDRVPSITLNTFDGQVINTADFAGKVIVINFWASWCQPCESEAAELEEAWLSYRDGGDVIFLGVDYVDTEPDALAYLSKFNITYPNGPDLRTAISQMFRIKGVPETYIIDREGRLAYAKIGPFMNLDEIIMAVESVRQ